MSRAARGGQTVDIGRGKHAEFVRWTLTKKGWVAQTISGTFLRLNGDSWIIRMADGTQRAVDRDEWDWCQP